MIFINHIQNSETNPPDNLLESLQGIDSNLKLEQAWDPSVLTVIGSKIPACRVLAGRLHQRSRFSAGLARLNGRAGSTNYFECFAVQFFKTKFH